ncbi:MAG TPA: NfeD family protein [Clostridia bacterium]|nr:NfeD family protein [Clostridia bacterium]HPQ47054.1 NfeD family protein [Clostridia bacterium]HRX41746.1 NfeD family protein [Clostridia bacterium]
MGLFSFVENIELVQAILLTLGLLFLLAEIFIPGFGIAGITGIILFIVGIIMTANTFMEALVMFLILLLVLAVVIMIVVRSASKGRLSKTLVLNESLSKEKGFSGVEDMKYFEGREGVAQSMLRPSGIGVFDGVRLDVVAEGAFIEEGSRIRIVEVEGRRIVVEKIKGEVE